MNTQEVVQKLFPLLTKNTFNFTWGGGGIFSTKICSKKVFGVNFVGTPPK